jgi:hypothetical protein
MIDDGIVSSALRGHVLGSISDEAVLENRGNPDTSETITSIARTRAIDRALTADSSCVSARCRGCRAANIPSCRGHGGPRHSDWVERASEGNCRDAPSVSFATEPVHGLFCKRRWRRMCYQHNWVCSALAASLNRMPGVQAVLEPMIMTRRAPGDQRRSDIKVKSGTSWILDVGIICPGSQHSQRLVGTAGLTRRHGRAALRGISRALALQQGYMLAQIAKEMHAPDRAASGKGEGGNSDYQSTPQPMQALFLRIIRVHLEAEAAAAAASTPGAGALPPAAHGSAPQSEQSQ